MTKIDNALRTVSALPTQEEWADFLRKLNRAPTREEWAGTPETGSYIAPPNPNEAPIALDVPTQPEKDDDEDDGWAITIILVSMVPIGVFIVALHVWGWLL